MKDVAIVLDHLLQREAKPTPRNHKRSSPSTSVPRDAVVTDVPIGKPKTPRGPTIGVFVSDDSAMKPPAHADDPEWYEHPSGSDRVKDSANAGDATGKRPHGFYRRMVDDLDALLTKRRKKKDPFAEDPEDAIIEDTMRHASGTFPEDPEDPLGAVHDFSEAVAGEVNEKLGRRRRRRAQKASEGGGGSEGMTPTPIVQRDDEKPRKVVEHRYEQAGETPEGFARIRFSEKPREEKQVSPGGVGGMKAVTTDPAARIRGEGADMHPSDESELTRRRAMAKPTAKAGEKKPKDELEEMAASQKKETRAFEREEMKKAGDKDDEREHKVEALIDGELVQKPGEGHEHDAKMEECIEKVKANTPEGRDPDEFAHRVCYATMGKSYLENYNPNCPACFKTMRDLEDPDSYFAALRKAVKTGIVEPFRVHPADSGRFKSEVRVIATVAGQLVKAAATASEASA